MSNPQYDETERKRRDHIASLSSYELREIEEMECVVPLDHIIVGYARDELDARAKESA